VDRLFLDANVIFTAAHNTDGKSAFLFRTLNQGRWDLLSSRFAIEEARRNLAARYPQCLHELERLAEQLIETPQPTARPVRIALPEKDQPILLAAQAAKATHLLTGDLRHFGPHMNQPDRTDGLIITTVADYLGGL
jgi:predicted nucleic acid-binding protein